MNSIFHSAKNKIYSIYSLITDYFTLLNTKFHFPDISNLTTPFIIIGIPGTLCLVDLCLKFIPEDQDVVFVANGLDRWETNWAKNNLGVDSFVVINKTLPHAQVLDLFFDHYQKPFGIIDYDCYVFEKSLYKRLKDIDSNTMMSSVYCYKNKELNLEMFETFIMFLNSPVINKVKRKFNVDSKVTTIEMLPARLKEKLLTLGIDQNHYPDLHRGSFFDTLRLIYLLGLTEGYRCNFPRKYPFYSKDHSEIFHAGAGHKNWSLREIQNLRGTFLWRRALESCNYPELQNYYWKLYGDMRSKDVLTNAPDLSKRLGEKFHNAIENIINY